MKLLVFIAVLFLFIGTIHAQGYTRYDGYADIPDLADYPGLADDYPDLADYPGLADDYPDHQGYTGLNYSYYSIFELKNYIAETNFLEVRNYIIEQAIKYNVPVELALDIAFFESGLDPNVKSWTTAVGVYQFVESTWGWVTNLMSLSQYSDLKFRYDYKLNIDAAIYLMALGEYHHWSPYSGHKWKDTYYKYFPEQNN